MKKLIAFFMTMICLLSLAGCDKQQQTNGHREGSPVPERATLIDNLEVNGYVITTQTFVEGSDLIVDRVIAEKGSNFIDIVYGLTEEEAKEIFDLFFDEIYPDDYYALSRDGNYVYCVSDEETFLISGISDTASVGIQHVSD